MRRSGSAQARPAAARRPAAPAAPPARAGAAAGAGRAASSSGVGGGGGGGSGTAPFGILILTFGGDDLDPGSTNSITSPSRSAAVSTGSPFTQVPFRLPLSTIEMPRSSQATLTWASSMSGWSSRMCARRPEPMMTVVPGDSFIS